MSADTSQEALAKLTKELANLSPVSERQIDLSRSVRMPLDAIPALGTAFSSLSETLRTVATTLSARGQDGEALFWLADAEGNVITPEILQGLKDSSGLPGSTGADGGFAQARLRAAEAATAARTAGPVIPFDPATLFLAAALMQINGNLDSMASMQKELLDYAKLRDHAKLVEACRVIDEVREEYPLNSDNQQFLTTKGVAIGQAKRDAADAVAREHDLLEVKLGRMKAIRKSSDARKKADEILGLMKDYQLATYVYEYAAVLDVVLAGNYSTDYLDGVIDEMERCARRYADMYDRSLDAIKRNASKALGSRILRGLGAAGGALGVLAASTVIGDLEPFEGVMHEGAGTLFSKARKSARRGKTAMPVAKPEFTKPFIDSVRSVSRTYNEPMLVAVGSDSVYMVPADDLLA